jgi:hypothetical protein
VKRPNGYNALRHRLRVRQNPPACATTGRAISFSGHCKTVIGFGSPSANGRMATPYAVSFLPIRALYSP